MRVTSGAGSGLRLGWILFVTLLAACGRGGNSAREATDNEAVDAEESVEIYSWWQKRGSLDPLGKLLTVHHTFHPRDVITLSRAGQAGLSRKAVRARMLREDPPDTFEANAGRDLLQWVLFNDTDATESKLLPLDELVEGVAEWRKVIPPAIREQVSYQGKTYGVPVNVYRVNTVFYNKKVFERFGLTEPTSPADLPLMAEKLRGSGISLLAVGSREPWTLALLTFECLLVAREGPAFYSDYFHGRLAPDDLRMARTLSAALELSRYFNRDHDELAWTDAVDLVADGRAAMTVMGGWARSAFYGRGLKPGVDFGEIPFPGSANTFVFTSDTFSLPAAARNRPGARRLLTTMGLRETQRMINEDRGALSPRLDVPIPDDEPISLANHALLTRGALVLALSGIAPGLFVSDVTDSVPEMLAEHDIEPVMETLRSRHVLLH